MKNKYKTGELEAKQILMNLGLVFDENYYDDNSKDNMPDFKLKTGEFVEITQTKHHKPTLNKFDKLPLEKKCEIITQTNEARKRIDKNEYNNIHQLEKDLRTVSECYGSFDNPNKVCHIQIEEFECNNILSVIKEKDKKHKNKNGNIILFIFVVKDEFENLIWTLKQPNINGIKSGLLLGLYKNIFKTIYICEYDYYISSYLCQNQKIIQIDKSHKNEELIIGYKNINKGDQQ